MVNCAKHEMDDLARQVCNSSSELYDATNFQTVCTSYWCGFCQQLLLLTLCHCRSPCLAAIPGMMWWDVQISSKIKVSSYVQRLKEKLRQKGKSTIHLNFQPLSCPRREERRGKGSLEKVRPGEPWRWIMVYI